MTVLGGLYIAEILKGCHLKSNSMGSVLIWVEISVIKKRSGDLYVK
jgi:hypothetical protein